MDEMDKIIISLGEAHKNNPDEDPAPTLEKMGEEVPLSEKGSFYLCYGNNFLLFNYSILAIAAYKKSIKYLNKKNSRKEEYDCYSNLGIAHHNLANFWKAIYFHKKALKIAKESGEILKEIMSYSNLGTVYFDLGDYVKAIYYGKKALKFSINNNFVLGKLHSYINLGVAYINSQKYIKAIDCENAALKISEETSDELCKLSCYTNLGISYDYLKDFHRAIDFYEKALKLAIQLGGVLEELKCYTNLGITYHNLGDDKKSIDFHEKALKLAIQFGEVLEEAKCLGNLSSIYNDLKDFSQAYDYCKKKIEVLEKIYAKLMLGEHRFSFLSSLSSAYEFVVPLCLQLKKPNEAFDFLEKAKSRIFLDLISTTPIKPTVQITPDLQLLLNDEKTILDNLQKIHIQDLRQKKTIFEPDEADKILSERYLIYSKIEQYDPEYVSIRMGKPLPNSKIQEAINSQGRDVVLVEYLTTDKILYIFLISSRNKELNIETVLIDLEELTSCIVNYWVVLAQKQDLNNIQKSKLILSDAIINPISKYLIKGDLIYFIPFGPLHYVPFHTLEINNKPIINDYPISYLPSASLIKYCQKKGSGKMETCAIFGIDFIDEAEEIAELFNTKPYLGEDATKENLMKCMNKDILHFSCHGMFDFSDPLSSGVKLHDDKILTAREIFDMRLNTELVILSACKTGVNQGYSGDELVGLTRAFLYSGTPSVIVSLWSVNAHSTKELMTEFYTHLRNGKDKATSLQFAQKTIMEKKEYSHPYYWAPFVLIGDWE